MLVKNTLLQPDAGSCRRPESEIRASAAAGKTRGARPRPDQTLFASQIFLTSPAGKTRGARPTWSIILEESNIPDSFFTSQTFLPSQIFFLFQVRGR